MRSALLVPHPRNHLHQYQQATSQHRMPWLSHAYPSRMIHNLPNLRHSFVLSGDPPVSKHVSPKYFENEQEKNLTSQPWVSVVCMKLSCPHAKGALGCDVVLTASGCMRRTFLVKTTSRSGCSQLSHANATALSPVRRRVAGVQCIVRSSPSPVQSQCLERRWAERKYISCHSTTHCTRLGDRLCVIFP